MQSDENKVGLLAPVIYVGVELTCEAAKWGWNKLFGDSEEDIEKSLVILLIFQARKIKNSVDYQSIIS